MLTAKRQYQKENYLHISYVKNIDNKINSKKGNKIDE